MERPTAFSAIRTAWPVPSCSVCSTNTGSGVIPQLLTASRTAPAPWPTTTTIFVGRAARAAFRTCHRAGFPQMGCRTLGVLDFSRLPFPAAKMTAVKERGVCFSANPCAFGRGTHMVAHRAGLWRAPVCGSGGRDRTSMPGFKGLCPTIRRPRTAGSIMTGPGAGSPRPSGVSSAGPSPRSTRGPGRRSCPRGSYAEPGRPPSVRSPTRTLPRRLQPGTRREPRRSQDGAR